NKHYGEDESSNWRVIPLQAFDLLEHARGTDGPMQCMLAFGFAMQDAETVICSNCPRLRMVSFPYSVRRDAQTVTFSFHPSIFDLMEEEWASIGLPHFAKELHCTDELDAASFDRLLQTAIGSLKVCRTPETDGDGLWAVFSMQRGQWISGSNMDVAVSRSLH
ncbi:MAG TPA: hypothetical protein VL997_06860, partial [Dyella sp.]|nr:hypothetical protein [Dyella sp.]